MDRNTKFFVENHFFPFFLSNRFQYGKPSSKKILNLSLRDRWKNLKQFYVVSLLLFAKNLKKKIAVNRMKTI